MFEQQMYDSNKQEMDDEHPLVLHRLSRQKQVTDKILTKVGISSNADQKLPFIIPDGWEIAKVGGVPQDVGPIDSLTFNVSTLRPRLVVKGRREMVKGIGGEELRMRSKRFGGYWGFDHGHHILSEQGRLHPSFQDFCIALPGTALITSAMELVVPHLGTTDTRELVMPFLFHDKITGLWHMGYNPIVYDYDGNWCLAV